MQINPYLTFDGQCEAAFKFYQKVLGGKIEAMIPHEGTPAAEHVPADWRSKIMHARLSVGDKVLMGSDAPPDHHSLAPCSPPSRPLRAASGGGLRPALTAAARGASAVARSGRRNGPLGRTKKHLE